jgi:tetratricopeptide (TPR) repeat protein
VGTTFWSGAVAAMERAPEAQVSEALTDMSERGIVRPARSSSVAGTREYSFAHALVRDVAYAQVPRLRRAHRHRAAAAWMESMSGERLSDVADVIVHHYEQAMDLLAASGAPGEAAELREPTRRFLRMAGDRAMQLDVARAYRRYGRALELCGPDQADSVEAARLKMKARAAAWQLGRNDEARRLCEEAREIFRRSGDVVAEADATVKLANHLWNLGESAAARPMLEEAAATLERMGPSYELIDAKVAMAFQQIVSGEPAGAIPMLNEVIAMTATHGSEDQRLEALGHRGMARAFTGDAGGIDDLRESLAGAIERGYATLTGLFYNNLAELVWTGEGPNQALDLLRAGIDFTDTAGIDEMALALRANSLAPAFEAGRWDELMRRGEDVVTRSEARGSLYWVAIAQPPIAAVLARTGRADQSVATAQRSLAIAREIGDPQLLVASLAAAALAEAAAGRPDRAVEFVREAHQATREGAAWYRTLYAADLVRSALACGDNALAATLLDGAEPLTLRHRLAIVTAEANLALARGDAARAEELFDEALRGWDGYGHVLEAALARLGLARARTALGETNAARDAAREAQEAFLSLGGGAQPLIAEADEILSG